MPISVIMSFGSITVSYNANKYERVQCSTRHHKEYTFFPKLYSSTTTLCHPPLSSMPTTERDRLTGEEGCMETN